MCIEGLSFLLNMFILFTSISNSPNLIYHFQLRLNWYNCNTNLKGKQIEFKIDIFEIFDRLTNNIVMIRVTNEFTLILTK